MLWQIIVVVQFSTNSLSFLQYENEKLSFTKIVYLNDIKIHCLCDRLSQSNREKERKECKIDLLIIITFNTSTVVNASLCFALSHCH